MRNECIVKVAVSAATYWIDRPYDYKAPRELSDKIAPGVRVVVPFSRGNRRTEGIVLAVSAKSQYENIKTVYSVLDEAAVLSEDLIRLALWMRERFFCTVYDAAKAMLPAGLWYQYHSVYLLSPKLEKDDLYRLAENSDQEKRLLDILFAHGGEASLEDIQAAFGSESPGPALATLVEKDALSLETRGARRVRDKTINFASLLVPAEDALVIARQKKRSAPRQSAVLELLCGIGSASVREISHFTGASGAVVRNLAKSGLVQIEAQEVFRRPVYKTREKMPLPGLNQQQTAAYQGISRLAAGPEARAALLFGVTGSGKTAVYINLIHDQLKEGKSSLLLVPEISLTPQMLETFSSYFGEQIALLHSSLSIGERYDEWKRVKTGQARVVIGTRSAVFAPVPELGIIIIDEEQESTYKSENAPRYHARDVAKFRCARAGALLLLGSATPDIESRYYAESGQYSYFSIEERFNEMELPKVQIVDMKKELRQGIGGSISSVLRRELTKNISAGEQSILFLNRRGANQLITCVDCGYTFVCPNCTVNLTFHSFNRRLLCHYCGHTTRPSEACPSCGGSLSYIGTGTQKVAEEISGLFPDIEVLRMDTDTVSPAGSHEVLLSRFREKKIPVMVGTQMVTKGLNFDNVTLVGVISADQTLYSGDYKAGERTFSLITQVVGRSGRGRRPGRAVIQTFTPENQTILQAAGQDYESFYRSEIQLRKIQHSPPFADYFTLNASSVNEALALRCCVAMKNALQEFLTRGGEGRVLGPAPMGVLKVNNRFRYRVTLACKGDKRIRELISGLVIRFNTLKEFRGVSVYADVNPS